MDDDHPKPGDPGFEALKEHLQRAFAAPESSYVTVTLEDFLARMKLERSAAKEQSNPTALK